MQAMRAIAAIACGRPVHGGFKYLEEGEGGEESLPYPRCQICLWQALIGRSSVVLVLFSVTTVPVFN
jgi:hypothetical protein